MPSLNVRILSFFLEMLSEKYRMTATFAISDGWNWNEVPGMPSQRVACLWVSASGLWGISTSTSRITDRYSSGFAAPRNRW